MKDPSHDVITVEGKREPVDSSNNNNYKLTLPRTIQIITTKHINHIEHGELLHNNHDTRCPCGLFHDAYHDPFRSDKGKRFIYNLAHDAPS